MKSKIAYFMERDTRLVVDNLSKVIIGENILLINYTILRKRLKDKEFTVIRYIKDKNRIIIYDKLKKYNPTVYKAFIDWAEENKIECYSIGKVITKRRSYNCLDL